MEIELYKMIRYVFLGVGKDLTVLITRIWFSKADQTSKLLFSKTKMTSA